MKYKWRNVENQYEQQHQNKQRGPRIVAVVDAKTSGSKDMYVSLSVFF